MGVSDLSYVVFAVCMFHAVAVSLYYIGVRRIPGRWRDARVRVVTHRTLVASAGLIALYLTVALLAFQLLPVVVGYPLFVAAWAGYGLLLASLLIFSHSRAKKLHAVAR